MTFAHGAQQVTPNLPILERSGQGCIRTSGRTAERPHLHGSACLESIMQAGGEPDLVTTTPSRRSGAAIVDERLRRTVVAVRGHTAAARTQIVVRVGAVDRVRRIEVPV